MVKTIKELEDIANDILGYMETKHPLPLQQYSIIVSMMRDSILVALISQLVGVSQDDLKRWSERIMEQKRKKKEKRQD